MIVAFPGYLHLYFAGQLSKTESAVYFHLIFIWLPKDLFFPKLRFFNIFGIKCRVAAIKRLSLLHVCVVYIVWSQIVWSFGTIECVWIFWHRHGLEGLRSVAHVIIYELIQ